jgi:hypothetical protein
MVRSKDAKSAKKAKNAAKSTKVQSAGSPAQPRTPVEIDDASQQHPKLEEEEETVDVVTKIIMIAKACLLLAAGSLFNVALQLALGPLYGSAPLASNYKSISLAGPVLSGFIPEISSTSQIWNERNVLGILGVMVLLSPSTSFWIAAWTGRMGSVSLGPAISLAVLLLPTSILIVVLIKHCLVRIRSPEYAERY